MAGAVWRFVEDVMRSTLAKVDERRAERDPLAFTDYEGLAAELAYALHDCCWQGTGEEPLSSESWHQFISAYEDADDILRRPEVQRLLLSEQEKDDPVSR